METIYSNGKNIGVLSFVSHAFGASDNLPTALLLGKRARLELDVSFRSSGVHLCLVLSCFFFRYAHTFVSPPRVFDVCLLFLFLFFLSWSWTQRP